MVNRGNVVLMARDAMVLFARHDTSYKSHKWSSNVRDGDCRDSEKILCNKFPLKNEVRERGRGEMLYENAFEPNTVVRRPTIKNKNNISNT